ncbi:hypothetical protein ACOJTA_11775 [Malaciobacter sp. WC5094]|uniref:hypothetical protein n=1 Tax=Arcobacter sp. YIC-80 TaxID=3376683 RepID=UPI0038511AE3
MENQKQKIEKLENLILLLEGQEKKLRRKPSLKSAKMRLRLNDPGFDISNTMTYLNTGSKKEMLISFLSDNYLTPFLIKLISSR